MSFILSFLQVMQAILTACAARGPVALKGLPSTGTLGKPGG